MAYTGPNNGYQQYNSYDDAFGAYQQDIMTQPFGHGSYVPPPIKSDWTNAGTTPTVASTYNQGATGSSGSVIPLGGGTLPSTPPPSGSAGSSAPQTGGTLGPTSGGNMNPFSLASPPQSGSATGAPSSGGFNINSPTFANYSPTMGAGPGGGSSSTNFNPAAGVQAGTFDATRQPYQLGGEQQSDVNAQAQLNTIGQGNPFQQMSQAWGNTAGAQAAGQGTAALGQGNNMYNASNAVLNTAFDPQQQLYNRMNQQNTDQTNAAEAQRGITMSPYGANVANTSKNNFNIDWQNAQLQRQVQGLGAAGTGNTTGANLGSTGVNQTMAAGQLPYSTGQQGLQNTEQTIQDYLAYLGKGQAGSAGNSAVVPTLGTITQAPPQYNQAGWQMM